MKGAERAASNLRKVRSFSFTLPILIRPGVHGNRGKSDVSCAQPWSHISTTENSKGVLQYSLAYNKKKKNRCFIRCYLHIFSLVNYYCHLSRNVITGRRKLILCLSHYFSNATKEYFSTIQKFHKNFQLVSQTRIFFFSLSFSLSSFF